MSNYTTQIRFICESKSGLTESTGFSGIMEAIEGSVQEIFNFDWPIFDESYRLPLEVKILRHFYTREIGEETFGLWQLRLCDRLNVIMPYYNQLYESELIKFNPMWDVDLTTTHEKQNDNAENGSETASGSSSETRNRGVNKLDTSEVTNDVDFNAERKDNAITEQDEDSMNNNVVDTSNIGVWDSKTFRSNIGTSRTDSGSNKKNTHMNRYSDTPQGNVNIFSTDGQGNVGDNSVLGNGYLTNMTLDDDETNRTATEKGQTSNDGSEEGKTIQDWTKQDKESGNRSKRSAGTEERAGIEKTNTKNSTSGIVEGTENEKVTGSGSNSRNRVTENKGYSTEDFIQHISGKRGGFTYSKLLNDFRTTFLNIDRMILNELEPLFIGLWE